MRNGPLEKLLLYGRISHAQYKVIDRFRSGDDDLGSRGFGFQVLEVICTASDDTPLKKLACDLTGKANSSRAVAALAEALREAADSLGRDYLCEKSKADFVLSGGLDVSRVRLTLPSNLRAALNANPDHSKRRRQAIAWHNSKLEAKRAANRRAYRRKIAAIT
jgi:hypothetical protein